MAQICTVGSLVLFVFSGVSFVCALVFWFAFHIPRVMGDLSGRTARKAMDVWRRQNEAQRTQKGRPVRSVAEPVPPDAEADKTSGEETRVLGAQIEEA